MPDLLGEYTLDTLLRPDTTWLARDPAGRRVVLKRLPDDCCPRGQLHPSIKLRLQRLRELPLGSFVNLIGVERTAQGIMLISEYADGTPLDRIDPAHHSRLLRELRLAVLAMHQHGMVHGAIKPGNVIVDGQENLKIIDPSPLLHDDPQIDLRAMETMEAAAITSVQSDPSSGASQKKEDAGFRQRTVILAVALAVIALGAAVTMTIFLSE